MFREKLIKTKHFFGTFRKYAYLCTDRIRHASRRTANQGGSFILYVMNIYTKQPISIDDQIAKLRSLGLIIADEDRARKTLSEGNTRTTAVFTIQYLRSLGFDVDNDQFARHSWYFRNALLQTRQIQNKYPNKYPNKFKTYCIQTIR